MFEDQKIGVACPKCGHKAEKTIAWLKTHDKLSCAGCGSDVVIDSEQLFAGIKEAKKAVTKFTKFIRGLGKRR
ncbi:hypothetical protein [Brucella pseudogrignonensis]|uniref:hypothetical protein n=1 Tax=Brucella pseudogrignonensis TaxID=419475 RepID=UPI003D98252E